MSRLRPTATAALLVLALRALRPGVARAEDPPPAPAPAPDSDPLRIVDLARASALHARSAALYREGRHAEAIPLAREALAIRLRALGEDHRSVGQSLDQLAALLEARGEYPEARALYGRVLAIDEKLLGKDHPDVAMDLNNVAELLRTIGAYGEARPLYDRALAIQEKALGKDHLDVALTLNNLAALLHQQQAYREARPLLRRALLLREKALGPHHPDVATSLSNLAVLVDELGAYGEAHPLFQRALAIREKALGAEHPLVAMSLENLALNLRAQGAYGEARSLFERALAIHGKTSGMDSAAVAGDLDALALLLDDEGAYAEARPLYERALALYEKTSGPDHLDVARCLGNLAGLRKVQGAYEEARPLAERALAILERRLGTDHTLVATALENLAAILHDQRAYAEARPLYARALAIREKVLGTDHPDVAGSLNNLATLLAEEGDAEGARPLYARALAIREAALGKDHPLVAASLGNLAQLLRSQGAVAEAQPLYARALAITEAHARGQLSALSSRQRLALLRSTRYRLDDWVAVAPRMGLSGYPEVLRFRGLVARTEAAERVLSRRADADDRRSSEALRAAQRDAARLANAVPSSFRPEVRAAWRREYAEACAERERRTRELTVRIAPLRLALERLDLSLADVQAQLGPDEALVDFLRVGGRYLAWIVRRTGDPVRIDVGDAVAIEAAGAAFVEAITRDLDEAPSGGALRSLLWEPVARSLGDGVGNVVICPDAALAAVPFAALPGRQPGRRLLDEVALSYVMSAQDLVPSGGAASAGVGALLVGGVDYEHADPGTKEQPLASRQVVRAGVDRAPRGGAFAPIPGTRVEVEELRDRFGPDATTLWVGAGATESRLRDDVRGRRFLHVATHGFTREELLTSLYARKPGDAFASVDAERQMGAGHDPMLLSGLAMAGANPREGAAGDDGILTALEASYLDLDGVDLVTLSACESARGTAESGEGVQGLVSAFQMAGARRVVASLWRVDDEGTRRLMGGFYERVLRKERPLAPADALREAALALRDGKDAGGKARFAAPRYWAPFVAYGR